MRWYDRWVAETGENPPPVVFGVLHDMVAARAEWEPRGLDDAYHRREWRRKQQEHREQLVKLAERDVCLAVERALDAGATWSPEVADAVAVVRLARAWAPLGWFNADDIDAFLVSDLSLDDWIDARVEAGT